MRRGWMGNCAQPSVNAVGIGSDCISGQTLHPFPLTVKSTNSRNRERCGKMSFEHPSPRKSKAENQPMRSIRTVLQFNGAVMQQALCRVIEYNELLISACAISANTPHDRCPLLNLGIAFHIRDLSA
jgi:hypothetical protein